MSHEEKSTRSRPGSAEQRRKEGRLPRGERGTSSTVGESAGAPLALTEKDIVRFWSKVDKNGPLPDQNNPHYAGLDRCWVWTASRYKNGYGAFGLNNKVYGAHRIAWQIVNGTLPEGEGYHGSCVLHSCDQKTCCNPAHLRIGSNADNVRDMMSKERNQKGEWHYARLNPEIMPRGEENGNAKITAEQAVQIRKVYAKGGFSQKEVAAMFGVSQMLVSLITRYKLWAHIP